MNWIRRFSPKIRKRNAESLLTNDRNDTTMLIVCFSKDSMRHKEIAGVEAQIYRLIELLNEQRAATLDNVRRKQAKAGEDLEEDDVDAAELSDDEPDREDDGLIYNPKNLPLGWDGKVKSTKRRTRRDLFFCYLAHSLLVVQTSWIEYVF